MITWNGGRCPVAMNALVKVEARDGRTFISEAGTLNWAHFGVAEDIMYYHCMDTVGSALATQEGGDHYKKLKIQPIEYIHANGIPFAEGSVIKYVTRWRDKNGVDDLRKARHFLDLLIELETRK